MTFRQRTLLESDGRKTNILNRLGVQGDRRTPFVDTSLTIAAVTAQVLGTRRSIQ